MKFLINTIFLLCLAQYAAALVLWPFGPMIKRSTEEPKHVGGGESLVCKIDEVFLACRALGPVATSFCASYLHISTSTSIAYTTVPTITTIPFTLTTSSTTTTTTTTTDVFLTSTTTTTTTTEAASVAPPKRRAVNPAALPIPPLLGKFVALELSSACSCLSIKSPVTTSTITVPTVVIATSTGFVTTTSTSTTVYTTSTTSVAVSTSIIVDSPPATCAMPGESCNKNSDCCFEGLCDDGSCIV